MLTPEQQTALTQIAQASVACEEHTGLPATLSAAQCIFESGWLERCPGNNCFGIMEDSHGSGVQYFMSHEYVSGEYVHKLEAFEKYDSLKDCFIDHARLLVSGEPYTAAWDEFEATNDLEKFVMTIGPIYSTTPGYAETIWGEMNSASVVEAIRQARELVHQQTNGGTV